MNNNFYKAINLLVTPCDNAVASDQWEVAKKLYDKYDWDAMVALMDAEAREEIHSAIHLDTSEIDFLHAYCILHRSKFEQDFKIN